MSSSGQADQERERARQRGEAERPQQLHQVGEPGRRQQRGDDAPRVREEAGGEAAHALLAARVPVQELARSAAVEVRDHEADGDQEVGAGRGGDEQRPQLALAQREVEAHERDDQRDLLLAERRQDEERHREPAPVLLEEDEGEEQQRDGERHRVELVQHRELERGVEEGREGAAGRGHRVAEDPQPEPVDRPGGEGDQQPPGRSAASPGPARPATAARRGRGSGRRAPPAGRSGARRCPSSRGSGRGRCCRRPGPCCPCRCGRCGSRAGGRSRRCSRRRRRRASRRPRRASTASPGRRPAPARALRARPLRRCARCRGRDGSAPVVGGVERRGAPAAAATVRPE